MANSYKLFCIQCGNEIETPEQGFYCSDECMEEYHLPFYESTDPIEDE